MSNLTEVYIKNWEIRAIGVCVKSFVTPSRRRTILLIALTISFLTTLTTPQIAYAQEITSGQYITALDWDSIGSKLAWGTGKLLIPWSSDNSTNDSHMRVVEPSGSTIFAIDFPHNIYNVEISPSDDLLLMFAGSPMLWDLNTEQSVLDAPLEGLGLNMVTWDSSGDRLLLTGVFAVLIYDALVQENVGYFADILLPTGRFSENERFVTSISSSDGVRVASSTTFGTIYMWNTSKQEGTLEATFMGHTAAVQHLTWNANLNLIASGDSEGNIFVWDPNSGDEVMQLSGHTDAILDIDWRPNGQQIVSTSLDGTLRVWEWPSGEMEIVESGFIISAIAYSPDGTKLAYGGEVVDNIPEIEIVDAPTLEPTPTLTLTPTVTTP